MASRIVSNLNGNQPVTLPGKMLFPTDSRTWEVMTGDLLSDHKWHPVAFDSLQSDIKKLKDKLEAGAVISYNACNYRRSTSSGTGYEVQLRETHLNYQTYELNRKYHRFICRYDTVKCPPKLTV
jgi:hypothetical protein